MFNNLCHFSDGIKLARRYKCKYTEISAMLNHKIEDLLVGVVRQIKIRPKKSKSFDRTRRKGCFPKIIEDTLSCLSRKDEPDANECENLLVL